MAFRILSTDGCTWRSWKRYVSFFVPGQIDSTQRKTHNSPSIVDLHAGQSPKRYIPLTLRGESCLGSILLNSAIQKLSRSVQERPGLLRSSLSFPSSVPERPRLPAPPRHSSPKRAPPHPAFVSGSVQEEERRDRGETVSGCCGPSKGEKED